MKTLMVYGAAGYTGRMATEHATTAGLDVIVAGRAEDPVRHVAAELGLPWRTFPVDDPAAIAVALEGVDVLLNAAGPFMRTAAPLIRGGIKARVHYLDFAAELDSYRLAEALDEEAKAAGVMLLPGSGGSVAMLGSLASHAAARVADPREIRIALHVRGSMSRGSAISATENLTTETLARVGGNLVSRSSETRPFDFGLGEVDCFSLTLPDLITIGRATGAPDVETFIHVSGDAFPKGDLKALPAGPDAQQRAANRYQAAVEVTGADGTVVRSVLDTVNGYTFTALAAAEAARRVLAGEVLPGFQTPADLFGAGFAETIADTTITDLSDDGEDGAARLTVELADSPVHAAIDQNTVEWTVSPIRHAQDGLQPSRQGTIMTDSLRHTQAADRFAVVEALYRFATGIDRRDWDLFASAIAEDVVSDFGPASAKAGFDYPVIEGRENLIAALSGSLSPFETTHSVSNPLVTLDRDTARLDALVEAQHVLTSDPSRRYLMKNRYDVELARRGDVWVITRNTVDNVWRSGDVSVMSAA